jgi:glycerol transport system ATP-binding protein
VLVVARVFGRLSCEEQARFVIVPHIERTSPHDRAFVPIIDFAIMSYTHGSTHAAEDCAAKLDGRTMQLVDVSFRAGSDTWLYPMDVSLKPGINVLLGATSAGKTTLMRLMAGLEQPTSGRVLVDGKDVTGTSVQRRNLAMVYQQFINYPSLSVFENIASPLRLARQPDSAIRQRVHMIAETLRLTPFLERRPAELSGGQQQRAALARALAKDAELVLLDEPLVNLDYKLREDLRNELRNLFAGGHATVVYATTEPHEALQLGDETLVLGAGRLVQHGNTLEIFRRPATLEAARAFSDPPLNEIRAQVDLSAGMAIARNDLRFPLVAPVLSALRNHSRDVTLGIRAHQFTISPEEGMAAITGRIDLAEISGSETYVHVSHDDLSFVAQLPGVHELALGERFTLHVEPSHIYCFDAKGQLIFAPH